MLKKPDRPVTQVFIHCSASDAALEGEALKEEIYKWHVLENKWSDIGYHYMIDKKGNLLSGRPLNRIPAGQKGFNEGTIAIMVHGLESFTSESMETLKGHCAKIDELYDHQVTFHGHCEVSDKSCPVFDYRKVLGLSSTHHMSLTGPEALPTMKGNKMKYVMTIIQMLLPMLLAKLSPEIIKGAFDALFDYIEDAVAESENKIDDAIVLPLIATLRAGLNIPDGDD